MVKVYSTLLVVGFLAVVVLIMGGSLFENLGKAERDPGHLIGRRGGMAIGGLLGFAMGGMAAEFSPLDLSWQVSLLVALLGGGVGLLWVWYASTITPEN